MAESKSPGRKAFDQFAGNDSAQILEMLKGLDARVPDIITEHIFGPFYTSTLLDAKTRELMAICALAAIGHAPSQLGSHIGVALRIGVTPEEVIEAVLQAWVYGGTPAALNALAVAREAIEAHKANPA